MNKEIPKEGKNIHLYKNCFVNECIAAILYTSVAEFIMLLSPSKTILKS